MIKALLVPLDSSQYSRTATAQAVMLARSLGARLTGLYVMDVRYLEMPPYVDYSFAVEAVTPVVVPSEIREGFLQKSERILSEFRETAKSADLAVETRLEEGVPSQVIAELGRSHDLVVMGKRGEHAKWGRDLLGSTAEQVARRSPTPVLLVEAEPRPLEKAVVLFDASPPANRALKLAAELTGALGLKLGVLTADDDASRAAAVQRQAAAYLEPLGLSVEYSMRPGRAAKAAAGYVEAQEVDLVVLGMRGQSVLHSLILGSTAEQLMRSIPLPVLLVP